MELLDYIKQIQIITPKPGDIVIVTVEENITDNVTEQLAKCLVSEFNDRGLTKDNISVILYKGDVKLNVIRKEE
jgi:hypothetical protein